MSIQDQVKSVIAEKLGVEPQKIVDDSSLIDDLGADSLEMIELLMALEDDLGIEIPDEDANQMVRVADIVEYVEQRAAVGID